MTGIDLAKFDFTPEQIRDINELLFDEILQAPDLNFLHTMFSTIVTGKEIGFIGEGGLVGIKKQTCGNGITSQDWAVGTRRKTWNPKDWEIRLDICADDLLNTAVVYAMNIHAKVDDLTDTDYMAIMVKVLTEAIKKFLWRLIWFNDVDADNFADNGLITNGIDPKYFNVIDGLWKQLIAQTVAAPGQLVNIAANGEASTALQFSKLTGDIVYSTLDQLLFNAPILLRQSATAVIACTQSFADGYQRYLESKTNIPQAYTILQDGIKALNFRGVSLVPFPIWDEMIRSFHNNGTKLYKPHRAILIEKQNLGIGTPSGSAFDSLNMWYEKKDRKNYIETFDKLDALVLNEVRFMAAL